MAGSDISPGVGLSDSDGDVNSERSSATSMQIQGDMGVHVYAPVVALVGVDEDTVVPAAASKRRKVSSSGSGVKRPRPEELRVRGEGELQGYFLKVDSESKEEHGYDFVSFP
ncbi:coenzyme F420-0:L-glutamate ligase [Sesbania bispinosa]|nr:coenzyme F420-0:L-glutamate ligase [Sesbania bispinosa]